MTKISVIIPVYNAENHLPRLINSVLLQTYSNLEIICINDGSTDKSLKILEEFQNQDSRIIIKTTQNSGASAARNLGLKLATGDYISFVDADDWLNLTLYQTFINSIENQPVDVWIFNMGFDYADTTMILPEMSFQIKDWNISQNSNKALTFDDCKNPFGIGSSVANKIYKRKYLIDNNINFKEGLIFEDKLFNFETLINAQSLNINFDIFYWYNKSNENSVTKTYSENIFDIFQILSDIRKILIEKNLLESYKYALLQHYYTSLFHLFTQADKNLRNEFFKKMKSCLSEIYPEGYNNNICKQLKSFNNFEQFLKSETPKEFFDYISKNKTTS